MKTGLLTLTLLFLCCTLSIGQNRSHGFNGKENGTSFYQKQLQDDDAVYFTPDKYPVKADGSADVSDALQQAISDLKTTHNFGILFIPEGTYLISKTIYVPQAIRLIGYGKKRPVIILAKNSPGFQLPDSTDKGKAKYMFWFTSSL
ncbi:MAG TPA: glycosyl hydrolase family 28-related protein, partial [Mucilaginibacter sp.]